MNSEGVGFKALLESLSFTMASAVTSSMIGSTVEAMFAPHANPEGDLQLIAYTAAQFLASMGVAHEVYSLLLSMRPAGSPPPIGDAVPYYFLLQAQPQLQMKFAAINMRLKQMVSEKLYGAGKAAANVDSDVQAPQGGDPQV